MHGSVGGKVAGGEGANIVPDWSVSEVTGSNAGCGGVRGRGEEGGRYSSEGRTPREFRSAGRALRSGLDRS